MIAEEPVGWVLIAISLIVWGRHPVIYLLNRRREETTWTIDDTEGSH